MKETNFSVALTQKSADFLPALHGDQRQGRTGAVPRHRRRRARRLDQFQRPGHGPVGPPEPEQGEVRRQADRLRGLDGPDPIAPDAHPAAASGTTRSCTGATPWAGWSPRTAGISCCEHSGGIDGFIAQVALLPRENAGLVILSNLNGTPLAGHRPPQHRRPPARPGPGRLEQAGQGRYRQGQGRGRKGQEGSRQGPEDDTQPSHPLADYVGDYENPGLRPRSPSSRTATA